MVFFCFISDPYYFPPPEWTQSSVFNHSHSVMRPDKARLSDQEVQDLGNCCVAAL